jgi:hypothetical protein
MTGDDAREGHDQAWYLRPSGECPKCDALLADVLADPKGTKLPPLTVYVCEMMRGEVAVGQGFPGLLHDFLAGHMLRRVKARDAKALTFMVLALSQLHAGWCVLHDLTATQGAEALHLALDGIADWAQTRSDDMEIVGMERLLAQWPRDKDQP